MSLGARTTKGGAKSGAKEGKHSQDKGKGTEKPQPKEKIKPQATTEQLRIAQMIDRKTEDPSDVRKMVQELMDMTCRSEDEVCSALHDADNDLAGACYLLLDETQRIRDEWQTNEKKKKKPPAPAGNGEAEPPRDPRSRSGPRPRRGEGEGGGRGRGGGRGGRGGGRGRGAGGRGGRRGGPPTHHHVMGNDLGTNSGDNFPTTEDWDNEEWSGSLSDTKVFTPSVNAQSVLMDDSVLAQSNSVTEDWDAVVDTNNGLSEPHIPTFTYHNTNHTHTLIEPQPQPVPLPPTPQRAAVSASTPNKEGTPNSLESYVTTHQHQPMGMSGSLSAAQTQYLSQLTQQSQRHDTSVYTSNYGVYGAADMSSQRKQRARVPPPSKIPMSAVEMPPAPVGGALLDVQFGALEADVVDVAPVPVAAMSGMAAMTVAQVPSQSETQVITSHETNETNVYPNSTSMLSESLSVSEATSSSQPIVPAEPPVTNTTSLESQLSASMKQLSAGGVAAGGVAGAATDAGAAASAVPASAAHAQHHYSQHRAKSTSQQQPAAAASAGAAAGGAYAHHAVSHHPPVYGGNVYAPQVNCTTGAASLTGSTYPPSVTLSQYQPTINSYQTSTSASVYGGNALYTAAPYTTYQHHAAAAAHHKMPPKEAPQYDTSVSSSNSLTSTSTTQPSTAKVTTTTVSSTAGGAGGAAGAGTYAVPQPAAAQAFYTQQGGGQYAYDEQMMRSTLPHHMGGYYEMGYGARDGTFGLGAGERFGRAEAASPQQVAPGLPAGYAYFYQPPPTTYQYGVYPQYGGGGSNVTGVGGVGGVAGVGGVGGVAGAAGAGKVNTYTAQQQPPYDAQDTYKTGGGYSATGSKSGSGAPATADIANAMYAKAHVGLSKVNSYEKATFHSGTPPPFGAGSHHLFIPPPPQHHHAMHHAQPQHQMDVRVNSNHNRRESGPGGARNSASSKPSQSKAAYNQSYWSPN